MGISSIRASESMSVRQPQTADNRPVDSVSKNIQNEISDAQRQKQGLSSKEDIPIEEKMKKSRELQQEISSLNVKLRQRELVISREQKKEAVSEDLQKEIAGTSNEKKDSESKVTDATDSRTKQDDTPKTDEEESKAKASDAKDSKISDTKMTSIIEAESDIKQTKVRNAVITKMQDGIVTLKSEIRQDENRGENVEKKKAELAKQEAKLQRAASEQLTDLNKATNTMAAAKVKSEELTVKTAAASPVSSDSRPKIIIDATNISVN